MRDIKFRLINVRKEIVGYEKWCIVSFNQDADLMVAPPSWLYSKDGVLWIPTPIKHRWKDQYAGIDDKNSNAIYERDIINIGYIRKANGDTVILKATVEFRNGVFGCLADNKKDFLLIPKNCEIIGSVYEAPELIKDNDESKKIFSLWF